MKTFIQSCSICKYSGKQQGFKDYPCQRYAPVMEKVESFVDGRQYMPRFPIMKGDDWCGDFENE